MLIVLLWHMLRVLGLNACIGDSFVSMLILKGLKETSPLFLINFLFCPGPCQGCIPKAATTAHALGLLLDPSPATFGTVVCVCV